MSGTVLVVTSGKGGVGKSTTALNLGVALGVDGHSAVVVDADLGMANLGAMVGLETDPTLHDVLADEADVESAVVTEGDAFGVVPGGRDLAAYADADPGRLPEVLAALAERYEYVVVDAGAGLGYADVVPVDAADGVLLVTTPSDAAIGDTAKLAEFSALVDARIRGVVVTRADGGIDAESIAAEVGTDLLGVVPEDPAVPGSTEAGVPLEQHAPDSPAAAAYRRLADVVTRRSVVPDADEAVDDATDTHDESGEATETADESGEAVEDDAGEATGTVAGQPEDVPAAETAGTGSAADESEAPKEASNEGAGAGDEESADGESADDAGGGLFSRLRGLF
jgi:septum site-determining protein MinD